MENMTIRNVSVTFPGRRPGQTVRALDDINLTIRPGDFVVALGASGCGKTTLLSLMAGFIAPTQGELLLGGEPIAGPRRGSRRGVPETRAAAVAQRNRQRRIRPQAARRAARAAP
ncbi:ABC-type taurine transport system ATPase subunit [Paraburkholderia bryophila]|uniref:ABC-type taurine transport system ATPase subunit n=1 Tax=Paraburkholderia bryophila TaxID=420952 RepID=A0A7Y9WH00_9BURK|nr:ABC-type taurine transport system ATPase subunit [Paraburkholderia bryophila]